MTIVPQWPYLKTAYAPDLHARRDMLLDGNQPGHISRDTALFVGLGPVAVFDMEYIEVYVYAINFDTLPQIIASLLYVLEWAPKIVKLGGVTTLMPDTSYSPVYNPQREIYG
jgi:hypothetical protein